MPEWLKNIPDNYTAQLAIMGWFLTITSKMTGYNIPGVGVAPGGIIEQPRDAIAHYLMDMETLADAMAVKKSWDRPQYAILKEMYLDLKRMHYSFRVNRSWSHNKPTSDISMFRDQKTGEFRPMDGDEAGPKKGKRKDFGHGNHGVGHGHHGVGHDGHHGVGHGHHGVGHEHHHQGPKFSAERGNRRDFPDTKEEFDEMEKTGEEQ